jgi:hypothetical protein
MRGLSEPAVAEVLDVVRAHEAAAGHTVNAEFGTAEDCAKQLPGKKSGTPGTAIVIIGEVLAVA